jgi:DNA-binding transcriptional regulator YdaS (Cro superfamily)
MEAQTDRSGIATAVMRAGTQEKLAQLLGVSQQAISHWVEKGWVPLQRAVEIERHFAIPRVSLVNPKIVEIVIDQNQA